MDGRAAAQKTMKLYLYWPLFLIPPAVLAIVLAFLKGIGLGFIVLAACAVFCALAFVLAARSRDRMLRSWIGFANTYMEVQGSLLGNLDLPLAVIDRSGRFLWENKELRKLITKKDSHRGIGELLPELKPENYPKGPDQRTEFHVRHNGRSFHAVVECVEVPETVHAERLGLKIPKGEEKLYAVSFFDETGEVESRKEIEKQKLAVVLVYLDNYDETLENLESVRQSLFSAMMERKIQNYFRSYDALLSKNDKDKYTVVLRNEFVPRMIEDKFSLVEDAKTINIGNESSVTLSMGIGMNGGSYVRNFELGRRAIDLALGRGGDQVVIKDKDSTRFFGGKSQQVDRTTQVRARVKALALREMIETRDRLLIMGHKDMDIDVFGSAIGLYRAAEALGKPAHIVASHINSSVRPMISRFADSTDYQDDLIVTGEQAMTMLDDRTLLAIVDVNRPSYTDTPRLFDKAKNVVVLDHHRQTEEEIAHALVSYIEPNASSSSEMVTEILQYISDNLRLKPLEAEALYAGIVIDTNNFTNKTGVRTFEAAAYLRRAGADITRVKKLLRENMSAYKARAQVVSRAEQYMNDFAISTLSDTEGMDSPAIIGAQAANELLSIDGVKASFVLTDQRGTIYVSARSIDDVNVQLIMEKMGGGGHMTMAGAQITDMSLDEAVLYVKETIRTMKEEGEI